MKDKLLVLVPTRGRPHNAQALRDAFDSTQATADLLFVIDKDDPELANSIDAVGFGRFIPKGENLEVSFVSVRTR